MDHSGNLRDKELEPPPQKDNVDRDVHKELPCEKKQCRELTECVNEKMDTINLYQRMLYNSRLELAKREVANYRKMRQLLPANKVEAVRGQGTAGANNSMGGNILLNERESRLDAALLLPEEIWSFILGNVTVVKDIRSCTKVCTLFERILDKSKTQWLFKEMFPFIIFDLGNKTALRCRAVCKEWCSGVDQFLQNYRTLDPCVRKTGNIEQLEKSNTWAPFDIIYCRFGFTHSFEVSYSEVDEQSESSTSETFEDNLIEVNYVARMEMKNHGRSPFVGNSVRLRDVRVNDEVVYSNFYTNCLPFLEDFRKHIWHLGLTVGYSPSFDVYKVILRSLLVCQNLRTLWMDGGLSIEEDARNLSRDVNDCVQIADNSCFESLKIFLCDPNILIIQDKLVDKFKAQLKHLIVQLWNPESYPDGEWSSLLKLEIPAGNSGVNLQSLKRMEAPNLQSLTIELNNQGVECLEILLELSNHFPELRHLTLVCDSRLEMFANENVVNLPVGLSASHSLTSMDIKVSLSSFPSYNFLMCFPFLQRLHLEHRTSNNDPDNETIHRKNEIFDLAKYLYDNTEALGAIYTSNVWKLLPFLRVLKVELNESTVPLLYFRSDYEYYQG